MSFSVNKKRQETMLERIGEAAELVDDLAYLPWYRSVQIMLEKLGKADEWGRMIEAAKAADIEQPIYYFRELCKRVKAGTYKFVEKIKEIPGHLKLFIDDKLVRFGFDKQYRKYWRNRANEFINKNSQAGFIELLEYAQRKKVSQQYLAKALLNCKPPRQYYQENVIGGTK